METLGRYRLLALLGRGAFGEVLRARLEGPMGFNKELAIKRIHEHLVLNKKFVDTLVNEARLGGMLRHSNIVETYEFAEADGRWYIAMEYIRGVSLQLLLDRCGRTGASLPARAILEIGEQICAGLQYAHRLKDPDGNPLGLIHRDLKPANLMINGEGTVKVLDFGMAKAATNLEKTATGVTKGTPSYMSPEQIMSTGELDARSDLFTLGAILYEAVTGEILFSGGDNMEIMSKIVTGDTVPEVAVVDQRVPGLAAILDRALVKAPAQRWDSAQEMGVALRRLRNETPGSVTVRDLAAMLFPFDDTDTLRLSALPDSMMSAEVEAFAQAFFDKAVPPWDPLGEKALDASSNDGESARQIGPEITDSLDATIMVETGEVPSVRSDPVLPPTPAFAARSRPREDLQARPAQQRGEDSHERTRRIVMGVGGTILLGVVALTVWWLLSH